MKRPPGIWFLLSAGVLWLSIRNVYGLKATELIFKRTVSSSTTDASKSASTVQTMDEVPSSEAPVVANATKSNLTGIPQLDYIYDPNLPRELNGYNLSSYPFFSLMPENITFKCDGLHDGFYASVQHKCQVYHHCLSGTRYDFLCANYTAFDQKTFICHFVSEVDCNNSPKYWHRNDALYIAASTTTIKPTPIVLSPALTAMPKRPPPPIGRRRRPLRRRPQYEYYDDEEYDVEKDDDYEEPPRRRRKRPRPRPRPIYEDDYDEYDDRYERRGSGRRNEDEHRHEEGRRTTEDRDTTDKRGKEDTRRKEMGQQDENGRHSEDTYRNENGRHNEDERRSENRRPSTDGRRTEDKRRNDDKRRGDERRGTEDKHYVYEGDDKATEKTNVKHSEDDKQERRNNKRNPYDERRYKDDRRRDYEQDDEEDDDTYRKPRPGEKRRPYYDRPRKPNRRPYEDDDLYDDDRRSQSDRPHKTSKIQPENDGAGLVKPHSSSSVFGQPRMPPRVKPPMPKNVQKTSSERPTTVKKQVNQAEYDDEYEDELPLKAAITTTRAPEPERSKRPKHTTRRPPIYDEDEYEDVSTIATQRRPTLSGDREVSPRYTAPKFIPKEIRPKITSSTTVIPTTTTTTTTTEAPRERSEPIVRVVKRPFLPSRGGSPYMVRGLQPVGAKALDTSKYETESEVDKFKFDDYQPQQNGRQFPTTTPVDHSTEKEQFSSKPIVAMEPEGKQPQTPLRPKFTPVIEEEPRFNPKVPERNPLDILENEYDVTLNDALNPTIPNLPVRNFPTGFGSPSEYYYSGVRPRYDVNYSQPPESFLPKVVKQRDETVVAQPQTYRNQIYNNQNFRSSPQITQARTHSFYSAF